MIKRSSGFDGHDQTAVEIAPDFFSQLKARSLQKLKMFCSLIMARRALLMRLSVSMLMSLPVLVAVLVAVQVAVLVPVLGM